MKRVVITGAGAVTPIGNNIKTMWDSVIKGKHGFSLLNWFAGQNDEEYVAASVKDLDISEYFDKKEARRMDPVERFAIIAALDALKDAGSNLDDLDPFRVGVLVGSGQGGTTTHDNEFTNYLQKGNNRVSVFCIPMMISNMASGMVAMKTGFKGSNYCTVSACASGTHAIGEAFRMIKHGYLDACLAGGAEASNTGFSFAGFNNMKALNRTTDLDRASIPFDAQRAGFVMGEGAGILVLEELEHAKARGARIYAEITGYGATCDAYHITSPSPDGIAAAKAMSLAIEEGGLKPDDIDYVNAHGTSTPLNDKYETGAIKIAFGEYANKLAINSTKSLTGHLLGAAGGVEAIVTALSIYNEVIHATAGYKVKDPECDLDYVVEGNRKQVVRAAISNSLGFGGHNATICFKKYE